LYAPVKFTFDSCSSNNLSGIPNQIGNNEALPEIYAEYSIHRILTKTSEALVLQLIA